MSQLETIQQNKSAAIYKKQPKGFDNFKTEDLIIPRLRLLQALSDAVSNGIGAAGNFQDSLTEEIMGDNVEVVLLGMKNAAVYFELGKGLVCKSEDGVTSVNGDSCAKCPFGEYHAKFKEDGKPPKCSSTKEFMCVTKATVEGKENRPIAVSFMKTSYPVGKKIATLARLTNDDIFAWSYNLISVKEKNDKGTFYKIDAKKVGKLSDEECIIAEDWYNIFSSANVKVVDDDPVATVIKKEEEFTEVI